MFVIAVHKAHPDAQCKDWLRVSVRGAPQSLPLRKIPRLSCGRPCPLPPPQGLSTRLGVQVGLSGHCPHRPQWWPASLPILLLPSLGSLALGRLRPSPRPNRGPLCSLFSAWTGLSPLFRSDLSPRPRSRRLEWPSRRLKGAMLTGESQCPSGSGRGRKGGSSSSGPEPNPTPQPQGAAGPKAREAERVEPQRTRLPGQGTPLAPSPDSGLPPTPPQRPRSPRKGS